MKKHLYIVSFVYILFCSCSSSLNIEEYQKYFASEKHNIIYSDSTFILRTGYLTPELISLIELKKAPNNTITKEEFENEFKNFQNSIYFYFKIGLKNGENIITGGLKGQEMYASRIGYITYNMEKDFCLVTEKKDSIFPSAYSYNNTYGMSNTADFMLVFPKEALSQFENKLCLVYTDKIFGIYKKVEFEYNITDLIENPNLKF